jgi:vacuolar protein-sorting-associated protein 4
VHINPSVSQTTIKEFLEAIVTNTNVSFDDVVGLDQAKEVLRQTIILPSKFPQLFEGVHLLCKSFVSY